MPAILPDLSATVLSNCCLCPRQCQVNRRLSVHGYCRTSAGLAIAAITRHTGEEPVLGGRSGIANVFFRHCNLQCRYCQNYQISDNAENSAAEWSLSQALTVIMALLDRGIRHLGFVSPSHMLPQMIAIINELHRRGRRPVIIYNSNGYDRVESLRLLEDWVDVYLPDCKYMDAALATRWSGAADYPAVARAALTEMYRQKGSLLQLDDQGLAERGMIVRHLVLPGTVANSRAVLRFLAEELSPRLHLSLMSQYWPTPAVAGHPQLGRRLRPEEYAAVVAAMEESGFYQGWVQEYDSADCYQPDFAREQPFTEP